MTTQYNANYIETMPFSDTCAQIHCQATSAQSWTVPGTNSIAYQAVFEYASSANVYVALNQTPTVPTGSSVSEQRFVEFKPVKRYVRGGDVLQFITPDANAYIGVSLRQIQG